MKYKQGTTPWFICLCVITLFSSVALAVADGPDYFRLKSDESISMRLDKHVDAESVLSVPAGANGLRNLGCVGMLTFAEWSQMSEPERRTAIEKAWCQVEYLQVSGWIPQKFLEEDARLSPSFECSKGQGEVETLICEQPQLMSLDNHMHYVYQTALQKAEKLDAGAEEAINVLKATQRGWIKARNACWKQAEAMLGCVRKEYLRRIAELQAKWMLVTAGDTYRFTCPDRAEFYITFYETDTLPAAAVEYGDSRVIMIGKDMANGSRFDSTFGRYVWLKAEEALFLWDQYQDALTCSIDRQFNQNN